MSQQRATVAIGRDWMDVGHPKVQALEGQALIDAYTQTARDLDQEGFEASQGGIHPWDPKDHHLYRGLVWLKQRADELQIKIEIPQPESDIAAIFDPMQQPWIKDQLEGPEQE